MHICIISNAQLAAEQLAVDLSWRGIAPFPCTQQQARPDIPQMPDQGYWGRVNGFETELEKLINHH